MRSGPFAQSPQKRPQNGAARFSAARPPALQVRDLSVALSQRSMPARTILWVFPCAWTKASSSSFSGSPAPARQRFSIASPGFTVPTAGEIAFPPRGDGRHPPFAYVFPGGSSASVAHRGGQCPPLARAVRRRATKQESRRMRGAGSCRSREVRRPLPLAAFGRHALARRSRTCAGAQSPAAAARRALREARSVDPKSRCSNFFSS